MRWLFGFMCVVGLAVFLVGCGEECGAVGCFNAVEVNLVPGIEVTYDVTLLLDVEAEAFACVRYYDDLREAWLWRMQPFYGIASSCDGKGFFWNFDLNGTDTVPESVQITVNAEDGSWSGSLTTSPTYEAVRPNPGCPGACRFARLTITNDVGAFEVQEGGQ